MRTCEEYEALIGAFLDGELTGEDRAEVAAHLAACPACQRYFDDLVAIHDAFSQVEDAPVPEDFAEQVMARVRETPQAEPAKIIRLPHWKRWTALAACCALVALGVWSARLWVSPSQDAAQTVAEDTLFMTRDAAPPPSEESAAASDEPMALMMMDEEAAALPEEAPAVSTAEDFSDEQKQYHRDTAVSLPETVEQNAEPEADTDDSVCPTALTPVLTEESQAEPLSGIVTAGGEAVRSWVEDELGLEWESGRTYLLTEEEFASLLDALAAAGGEFRLEPGEGCWLLAE